MRRAAAPTPAATSRTSSDDVREPASSSAHRRRTGSLRAMTDTPAYDPAELVPGPPRPPRAALLGRRRSGPSTSPRTAGSRSIRPTQGTHVPTTQRPTEKIVRRRRRRRGPPPAPQGGGTIFTEPVLVVNQKAKLIEVNNEYAIYDQNGVQIGAVRQVGQSAAKKVLRVLTSVDQFMTHKLQVVDMQGNVLLALTRPAKVLKSRVIVQDGHGNEVGAIVQQNAIGKIRFNLEASGHTYGSINAENWRAWNFNVSDARRAPRWPASPRRGRAWPRRCSPRPTTSSSRSTGPSRSRCARSWSRRQPRGRHRAQAGQPRPRLTPWPSLIRISPPCETRSRARWPRTSRRSATSPLRCCRPRRPRWPTSSRARPGCSPARRVPPRPSPSSTRRSR